MAKITKEQREAIVIVAVCDMGSGHWQWGDVVKLVQNKVIQKGLGKKDFSGNSIWEIAYPKFIDGGHSQCRTKASTRERRAESIAIVEAWEGQFQPPARDR